MKTKLFAIGLCLISSWSVAQDQWSLIAYTSTDKYYALKGSAEIVANKTNEEVIVVTMKAEDIVKQVIKLEKVYVRTSDCLRKQGKVVFLDMDGNFKFSVDFIFGAGSIGTQKAETICGVYAYMMARNNGQGI